MIIILAILMVFVPLCYYADEYIYPSKWWSFGLMTVMALIIGFRKDVGVDYEMYETLYYNPLWRENSMEWVWVELIEFLNQYNFRARGFFLLTALGTMWGFWYGMKKYSPYIFFSIFIFIVCGFYFETSNTVRQCMAMSCIFAAFPSFTEKKFIPTLPLVIAAILLHSSAIIGLIIFLIAIIPFNRWILGVGLTLTIIYEKELMQFAMSILPAIAGSLEMNSYSLRDIDTGITSSLLRFFYLGFGWLIVLMMPRMVALKKSVYIAANMVLGSFMIYNVFYTFQPARRLSAYGFMFVIFMFPYLWKSMSPAVVRNIVTALVIAVFLAFLVRSWILVPYTADFIIMKNVYNI